MVTVQPAGEVTASSTFAGPEGGLTAEPYQPSNVVDGDYETYWISDEDDSQPYWQIIFDAPKKIIEIETAWMPQTDHIAKDYVIEYLDSLLNGS